jgi:hypothetical protein
MKRVNISCFLIILFLPFLCFGEVYSQEVAQTKIEPILVKLKTGVANKDVSVFKDIISFPLNVSSDIRYASKDGYMRVKTQKIENIQELQDKFDAVFVPSLVRLINCINSENLKYNPYKGFSSAYGSIWFLDIRDKVTGIRRFALTSLSTNEKAINKWLSLECKNT